MNRRDNCTLTLLLKFFLKFKNEQFKRKIYKTRDEAKTGVFNYIDFFYNSNRRHGTNNGVSPDEFEKCILRT